jgi:hypothetical protein
MGVCGISASIPCANQNRFAVLVLPKACGFQKRHPCRFCGLEFAPPILPWAEPLKKLLLRVFKDTGQAPV